MDLAIRAEQSCLPGLRTEHSHLAHDPHCSHQQQVQFLYLHLNDLLALFHRDAGMIGV